MNMRLLIVDDDLQTVEVVKDSIKWETFGINDVVIAFNVAGAKKKYEEKIPDICICDIEMPKGSGLDLLRWVRESNYRTEFIFFTCHESFEFATTAMQYNVISYITKPFNMIKIEMAVEKAIHKIQKENHLEQYKEFGEHWLINKKIVLEDFWRELLFSNRVFDREGLNRQLTHRQLAVDINQNYQIAMISVLKSQADDSDMDHNLFQYTLKKICAEILLDELDFEHTLYYEGLSKHRIIVVIKEIQTFEDLRKEGRALVETINRFLNCMAACYFSESVTIENLPAIRKKLEEEDTENILNRNHVFMQGEVLLAEKETEVGLDFEKLLELFHAGREWEIANVVKKRIESLSGVKGLNATVMHSLHQDFLQVVYAYLYKKEIQAHKLFDDQASKALNERAENSVFDMMKWINVITRKTMDYVNEVERSMTIMDKVKKFVKEHFHENITKLEVANAVFLTPDYLGKIFKAKEGVTLKTYINQFRIQRAKELLVSTEETISNIAADVGFDNLSYFSTIFKKEVGMSPNQYKKKFMN